MRSKSKIAAGIFLALLALVCFDATADLWPTIGVQKDVCAHVEAMSEPDRKTYTVAIKKAYKIACEFRDTPLVRVNVEGMRMVLSPDQGLFAIVGLFGLLGGALTSLFSLGTGMLGGGSRSPFWLAITPFLALAATVIGYVGARAILLPAGNLGEINPYGYMALAAMVGIAASIAFLKITPKSSS